MYAAIRPALGASTRNPTRIIRRRRYSLPHRTRSFHNTRRLAQNPTPPAGAESAPTDANGTDEKGDKKGDKTSASTTEAQVLTEDTDDLARKLQRSQEMARRYSSALRRSQRRNRARDLPPVVIPAWFLKGNVFCRDELRDDVKRHQRKAIKLSLRHRLDEQTTTCSIPLGRPSAGVHVLTRFLGAAWDTTLRPDQSQQFGRQLALALGATEGESVVQALEQSEDHFANRDLIKRLLDRITLSQQALLDQVNNMPSSNHAALAGTVIPWQRRISDMANAIEKNCESLTSVNRKLSDYVPSYVLAEVEATVAASLMALQPAAADPFPATKTNLILHCPSNGHDELMARIIMSAAADLGADVVVLHAQDLAKLGGDYLSHGSDLTPHSIRSMGYETYRSYSQLGHELEDYLGPLADGHDDANTPFPLVYPGSAGLKLATRILALSLSKSSDKLKLSAPASRIASSPQESQPGPQTQAEMQLEDLKLSNLLESLLDSTDTKRERGLATLGRSTGSLRKELQCSPPAFFNASIPLLGIGVDLSSALPLPAIPEFNLTVNVETLLEKPFRVPKSKIVLVQDFKELNATQYGGRIIDRLEEIVRKRRSAGESIMIVGTTCSEELTPDSSARGLQLLQSEGEADFSRTIVVPIESAPSLPNSENHSDLETNTVHSSLQQTAPLTDSGRKKIRNINLRHIQDMLHCLDPEMSRHTSAEEHVGGLRTSISSLIPQHLCWKVFTYDEVHRIALTSLGLHSIDSTSKHVMWTHVALAMSLLKASDEVKAACAQVKNDERKTPHPGEPWQKVGERQSGESTAKRSILGGIPHRNREQQMDRIFTTASKHEKRLMPGIANPDQIKTTFDQVRVPPETVDSIRTLTSMSFLRPDAFSYGVLATEKISGALLYGPPGTGKTMLAKAVAKESGCAVLEVSGSSVMDKYVGEGEKNVAAIFSLARKLSPCIVFLDEADAIFSSRDVGRERSSHRDILNQFLKEWDGLSDLSVFVMVATNRPFDLDDAVIRRLPRRLLVDLPTQTDRREILKIHLRGEQLDDSVDLEDLATRTPFYSGSDLKNVAVAAALACVKEENEQAAIGGLSANHAASSSDGYSHLQLSRDQKYHFPERRLLRARHFDKALQEISASISEDMSSLNAIKKFDEKYGDKKGKQKKRIFGIGVNARIDENAVRVRP